MHAQVCGYGLADLLAAFGEEGGSGLLRGAAPYLAPVSAAPRGPISWHGGMHAAEPAQRAKATDGGAVPFAAVAAACDSILHAHPHPDGDAGRHGHLLLLLALARALSVAVPYTCMVWC